MTENKVKEFLEKNLEKYANFNEKISKWEITFDDLCEILEVLMEAKK